MKGIHPLCWLCHVYPDTRVCFPFDQWDWAPLIYHTTDTWRITKVPQPILNRMSHVPLMLQYKRTHLMSCVCVSRLQPAHVTTTRTTWRPVGTGPPSCWWGTLGTAPRWTCGRSVVCSLSCCRGRRCGPGSLTWISCIWSERLSVNQSISRLYSESICLMITLLCFAFHLH